MVKTYKGTDDIEIEKLTKNHAFYNLVKKIHKKNISSNIMDEERYLKLIKVCETNKGCHNKLQAFQINKLYRQEFKWRAKYDIIIFGEIKVLVYKQDFLRDRPLPPLYFYQKCSYYGQLHDYLFSIHTAANDHC